MALFSYANNSIFFLLFILRFTFNAEKRKTFAEHTYIHGFELYMLMEIVCFIESIWKDIGLNLHQSISHQTLHLCIELSARRRNMEKVLQLPANYSAVASCELNLSSDCRLGRQTPIAPRSHKDREFCYHINSTCRQHRIYKKAEWKSIRKHGLQTSRSHVGDCCIVFSIKTYANMLRVTVK